MYSGINSRRLRETFCNYQRSKKAGAYINQSESIGYEYNFGLRNYVSIS